MRAKVHTETERFNVAFVTYKSKRSKGEKYNILRSKIYFMVQKITPPTQS